MLHKIDTRKLKEVNFLVETKTNAKVTKLNKEPEHYCSIQNEESANEIKTSGKLISVATEKINAVSDKVSRLSKKCIPAKEAVSQKFSSVKEAVSNSGNKAFAKCKEAFTSVLEKTMPFIERKGKDNALKIAIAGGLLVICFVLCSATCSFGYKVSVGDATLGVIPSKETLENVMSDLNDEVFAITGEEFKLPAEPKASLRFSLDRNMLSEASFAESLKSVSPAMIPAYTILVDGKMVVALPSEKMASETVEEYKYSFFDKSTDADVDFANDVEISYMFCPKEILHTKESAISYLLNGEFSYYTSDKSQTVEELADSIGVAKEMILKANDIENNIVNDGQILKVYSGRMFADIVALQHVQREEPIPFETVQKDSGELYQGITKVQTAGVEGVKAVDECITYINGVETKRDVLEESVLKSPKVQIELVGTKEPPPSVGTGSLTMPTKGNLSSRFGSRWGRQHKGIDLCAPVGTPIYAADNGTVTYSQFNDGGYGYMIQINHGNGMETYYAHCSELLVEKGQVVAKGDLIAKVGNTGRSTGAHLHFEVRQEGSPTDPLSYIS